MKQKNCSPLPLLCRGKITGDSAPYQTNQVTRLDLKTNVWTDITPTTQGATVSGYNLLRHGFAIAQAADESGFFVFGGQYSLYSTGYYLNDYLFFSYASNTWTAYGNATQTNGTAIQPRAFSSYAVAYGVLYVFGGVNYDTTLYGVSSFDLTSKVWSVDNNSTFGYDVSDGSATPIGSNIYVTSPGREIYRYTLTDFNPSAGSESITDDNSNSSSAFALAPLSFLIMAVVAALLDC